MANPTMLHVGIAELAAVRVAHKLCIFAAGPNRNTWNRIHTTFQLLSEWMLQFGLDPDALLHIGVPSVDAAGLATYGCCIEFPLPIDEEGEDVTLKSLPDGKYAVRRIEKTPAKISKAIRQFRGDYIPENQLVLDPDRPTYEIYYKDTMEYCVPILY